MGVAVGSVHRSSRHRVLPVDPGRSGEAIRRLASKCAALRRRYGGGMPGTSGDRGFDRQVLVDSLCRAARLMHDNGLTLSGENIPGHTSLCLLTDACPGGLFHDRTPMDGGTEGSGYVARHPLPGEQRDTCRRLWMQSTPATHSPSGWGEQGQECDFDAERFVRAAGSGYRGMVTLNRGGGCGCGVTAIRTALEAS